MATYWQDSIEKPYRVSDEIQDVMFRLRGGRLPVDHAHALSMSIQTRIPWLREHSGSGIHLIHVAESGNGWFRPEDASNQVLVLSRRTRLTLRVHKDCIEAVKTLCDTELNIGGYKLKIGDATPKLLSPLPTIFCRHLITTESESEDRFLGRSRDELTELGIHAPKLLCGRLHWFESPDRPIYARSLLLADLDVMDSITVQQRGLGSGRLMGCGLFLPHKGISAVNGAAD